jgi:uncharacterized protein (UPF0332 family)
VKPQVAAFLAKSREFLEKAQSLLDAHHWPDEAGRAAYLAGFHAAQALIFDRTGRAVKRHNGVKTEFHRLVRDDTRIDDELRAFLGFAYNLKAIADYETGPGSKVTPELAIEAIELSKRFVATLAKLIEDAGQGPTEPVGGESA